MPTVDQIRARIIAAMAAAGDLPIPLAIELDLSRDHIRDYLEGRKNSLKAEVLLALSERYSIPIKELTVRKEKQIRKRA